MKIIYGLAALLAFQVASAAGPAGTDESGAAAFSVGGFQVSPRVGKSMLHVNPGMLRSGQTGDFDTLLGGVNLSYTLPAGVMAELGFGSQGNWGLLGLEDRYQLREYSLGVGYQIATPHGFVITPKVGRSQWELYSRNAVFARPVSGQPDTVRGYQNFWELSIQKRVRDVAALGVMFKDNHYDFGDVRSIAFTASFYL
jgi:hypothetical protein